MAGDPLPRGFIPPRPPPHAPPPWRGGGWAGRRGGGGLAPAGLHPAAAARPRHLLMEVEELDWEAAGLAGWWCRRRKQVPTGASTTHNPGRLPCTNTKTPPHRTD